MTLVTKISETGSVEIPKSVRDANGWSAGTELELVSQGREVVLRPNPRSRDADFPSVSVEDVLASVPKVAGPPLNEEDIDRIVRDEAARRFDAKTRR